MKPIPTSLLGALLAATLTGVSLPSAARPVAPFPAEVSADAAPIALLVDLSSGQTLFAREASRRFVPASITKVMSAYVAFGLIADDHILPAQVVTVPVAIAEEWGGKGSSMFLERGDRVTIDQLLLGLTSVSANDGAVMLAEAGAGGIDPWIEAMNAAAARLDMRDSHFGTPNGWPDEGQTFTTARDLVTLAKAIVTEHPALYAHYFGREGYEYNGIAQANHDPMVGRVEGADGLKTGFTNQAGFGFLGSALRDGRRLALVVAASPSGGERDRAARALVEWGFDAFETQRLFPANTLVGEAEVQGGLERSVPLVGAHPLRIAVPRGTDPAAVTLSVRYFGPLPAPIAKGDAVADLEVRVPGQPVHRLPLTAARDVPEAGLWQRIRNGLVGLVT